MVRLPRFFGKKRGNRQTVSHAWGSLGEAVFYSLLLLGGTAYATVVIVGMFWPGLRLGLWGLGAGGGAPAAPTVWLWLLNLFLPTALLAIGVPGIYRLLSVLGKSDERRAAAVTIPDILEPVAGSAEEPGYPAVPTCDNFTNSPGTVLDFRLPIESPESWALLGIGIFAVLWNIVLVVLGVSAGVDLAGGRTDWLLIALVAAFASVGIASIVMFVRAAIAAARVGPTQLEISALPMRPGGRYELLLSQSGSGTFHSLSIALEQEERATFRMGTDTRTERRVVLSREISKWEAVELSAANRFEARCQVGLPTDLMHSFTSAHNSVDWRFVVRGDPVRRRAFTRVFPVIVFPPRMPKPPGNARIHDEAVER
jgi:hypothetical protein